MRKLDIPSHISDNPVMLAGWNAAGKGDPCDLAGVLVPDGPLEVIPGDAEEQQWTHGWHSYHAAASLPEAPADEMAEARRRRAGEAVRQWLKDGVRYMTTDVKGARESLKDITAMEDEAIAFGVRVILGKVDNVLVGLLSGLDGEGAGA